MIKTFEAYGYDYLIDKLISHLRVNNYTPIEINELIEYYSDRVIKMKDDGIADGIIFDGIIKDLPKTKNNNRNVLNIGIGSSGQIKYL